MLKVAVKFQYISGQTTILDMVIVLSVYAMTVSILSMPTVAVFARG